MQLYCLKVIIVVLPSERIFINIILCSLFFQIRQSVFNMVHFLSIPKLNRYYNLMVLYDTEYPC